jgi:hypothetical protein
MNRRGFAAAVAAYVVALVSSVSAADISGTWTASFETQIGTQNYTYTFKVDGSKLIGVAKSDNGETEITDGQVTGDTVTFVENLNFQGMVIPISYTGQIVSDDEIKFTRKVADFATEELVAKRAK